MSTPITIKLTGCNINGTLSLTPDITTVAEMRTAINQQYGVNHAYRMLFKGRILRDTDMITSIPFNSESKLMLVKSAEQKSTEIQQQIQIKNQRYEKLKQAVQALAKRSDDNIDTSREYYLDLTDQNGNHLDISENDRYTLVTGMTLHTKGTAALKRGEYKEAMEMFYLADESFQLCDEKFLNLIDNDKYLALDIVWTLYLQQDLAQLSNAQKWLSRAESGFRAVHGPNMERLRAIRRGFIPEMALYVRLYLLQAIVYHHTGDIKNARYMIQKAYHLNEDMAINDIHLATLLSAGYTTKHATRALRACRGDVDAAGTYLIVHREKQEERAKQRVQEREQKKLGKTVGGQLINMKLLEALQSMGYEKWLCVEAMRQCDNNQTAIMTLLTDPTRLSVIEATVAANRAAWLRRRGITPAEPSYDDAITTLQNMGFNHTHVSYAVRVNHGNVERSLQLLTQTDVLERMMINNPLDDTTTTTSSSSTSTDTVTAPIAEESTTSISTSTSSDPTISSTDSSLTDALDHNLSMSDDPPPETEEQKKAREAREEKQREDERINHDIYHDVVPDLEAENEDDDPEAYLDVDLARETQAIHEYMVLIGLLTDEMNPTHQQAAPTSPPKA